MRTKLFTVVAASALAFIAAPPAIAQVTVGTNTDPNCFPFGCNSGTYYQQVYSSTAFGSAGFITGIDFFVSPLFQHTLNTMTFTMSLSTTTLGLNVDGPGGISSANPNGNDGVNNTLFGTYSIGGAAPATLSFGGTPFFYDPLAGNLLVDLRVTSITPSGSNTYFLANDGDATLYSRAHDFGSSFSGWGLVTRFDYGTVTPEPATMTLLGTGLVGLVGAAGVRRRKRTT